MNDYISREALIKAVEGNPYVTDSIKSYLRCTAKNIPAADVVAVVRCRECKEWVPGQIEATDNFIPPRCVWLNKPMHADDYCSYGERSDDGDKKGM